MPGLSRGPICSSMEISNNSALVSSMYELPFEYSADDTFLPDASFCPKELFLSELAPSLVGGLQPGDVELFVDEQWVTTDAYSIGLFTSQFLEDNPEEKAKAYAFHKEQGIDRISSLIGYIEKAYGGDEISDREKWGHIFRDYPRLNKLMTDLITHENIEYSVSRILKIKQKLRRMPDLDVQRDEESGEIVVDDCLPGLLHPRDAALLGALGLLIGLPVTRSFDADD